MPDLLKITYICEGYVLIITTAQLITLEFIELMAKLFYDYLNILICNRFLIIENRINNLIENRINNLIVLIITNSINNN